MRKVYVTLDVMMQVPVKVELIIRADEDANVDLAVKRWAQNKPYAKADVEVQNMKVLPGVEEDKTEEVFSELLEAGGLLVLTTEVVDSK